MAGTDFFRRTREDPDELVGIQNRRFEVECFGETLADEGERDDGTDAADLALRIRRATEHMHTALRDATCERPLNELFVQVDAARLVAIHVGNDERLEMLLSRTALVHDAHEILSLDAHPLFVLLAVTPFAKRRPEVECEKFRNLECH